METTHHECGFILSKKVSPALPKAKLTKELDRFLKEQKKDIMDLLGLPKDQVHTGCFYDRDSKECKGIIQIEAKCSAHCLSDLNINNLIWASVDDEPFTISTFTNYSNY